MAIEHRNPLKSMLFFPLMAGTQHLEKPESKYPIIVVNLLALTLSVLVLSIGTYFYTLKQSWWIAGGIVVEVTGFAIVIALNQWKKFFQANLLMLIANGMFAAYWSLILGTGVSMDLLLAFLFLIIFHLTGSLFLYKERKVLIVSLVTVVTLMVVVQINTYYRFIAPLSFSNGIISAMRFITSGAFFVLIVLILASYMTQINSLLSSEIKLKNASIAKSTFLRETYHELRTPLNNIFGIIQLLQLDKDKFNTDEMKEIDNLYAACYTARNIINNVLDMSRIEAGKFNEIIKESFRLNDCIEHCVMMNHYIANARGIRISYTPARQLPTLIHTDKIILIKIINNLLSNAAKFSLPDSLIEVKASCNNKDFLFQVSNQGCINKEKIAKIFEPFFTERNQYAENTGLGLQITKHLIELLGGDISIESDNNYTVFTFNIPYEIAQYSTPAAVSNLDLKNNSFSGARAVIIEDDEASGALITKLISRLGINATLCNNGRSGLTSIESEKPDIVITDMHMEKMGGVELLRHIRETQELKNIPVIIVSGDAFNSASENILSAGADAFLTKPIHFKELYNELYKQLPQFHKSA
ncbi:ATP-binding response regulator [Chitinophaga nivalis]|uniref:histidine kinase n=1 Tax=Chitinophaga nivalis TaxID=2991709 RepID=A0ABT3IHY3_9BACT|nr:hybrid sensor histidine kinase/response regulator [Chitinophaga nivalis]MCW3466734.1 hybrid sensor histidine kinase/response regulator [Chitinophaga nivalis]MCW3483575.1 hybrid sensor histidine kinase/response regulator [Chitinophaga nivalis]